MSELSSTTADFSLLDDSVNSSRDDDIFFSPSVKSTSTPRNLRRGRGRGARRLKNKLNATTDRKVTCSKCKRKFVSSKAFQKHEKFHTYQDAARKCFDNVAIDDVCIKLAPLALRGVLESSAGGEYQSYVTVLLNSVETQAFKDFMTVLCVFFEQLCREENVALPSAVRASMLRRMDKYMCREENRKSLCAMLQTVAHVEEKMCYIFLSDFILLLTLLVCKEKISRMQGSVGMPKVNEEGSKQSADDFENTFDQSTVFNIAGACLRGFIRKALSERGRRKWRNVLDCITAKFLKGGLCVACPDEVEAWTAIFSQGGLLMVNLKAFQFFKAIAVMLQSMELPNGSLGHEAVGKRLLDRADILSLWDSIVDNLLENESIALMNSIVRSFTNTYGRGVVNRRLNSELKKGSVCIGLRGTLGGGRRNTK